jgi:hypothetical protein
MAFQSKTWEVHVKLFNSHYGTGVGEPLMASGVLFTALTVKYRKSGTYSLLTKTVAAADWHEIGGGLYTLRWNAPELDQVGELYYSITGDNFNPVDGTFDVVPRYLPEFLSEQTCIISGNVRDLVGTAIAGVEVVFRPALMPQVTSQQSLVVGDFIRTASDAFGNFSIVLARGLRARLDIEQVGIKQMFTVPNKATATLLEILPPIPPTP